MLEAKFYGTEEEKVTIHSRTEMEKIRGEVEKEEFLVKRD